MTELVIARLTATTSAADEARVRRLLAGLAERRLDAALGRAELPPGEWCIRRLDVQADLNFDRADASLEEQWADLLARAIQSAVTGSVAPTGFGGFGSVPGGWRQSRDAGVVHYRRREDALADVLGSLAAGSSERVWAWRQLGLLSPADPGPSADPAPAILAALRRQPTAAMPALLAALDSAGLAALHRLLTPSGWAELATIVLAAAGFPATTLVTAKPAESLAPESGHGPSAGSDPGLETAAGGRLAAKIGERSRLAAAFRRARFRVDPGTARAWAVLAGAEAEPALFARAEPAAALARLTEAFAAGTGSGMRAAIAARPPRSGGADRAPDRDPAWPSSPAAEPAPDPAGAPDIRMPAARAPGADAPAPAPAPHGGDRTRQEAGPSREPARSAGTAPDQPATTGEWPTRWGGLLFLLATANDAGIPAELLADDAFADSPLSWMLFHLGTLLVPAGRAGAPDPAQFALAGLLPADRPPAPVPTDAQRSRLGEHARRWAHATATRLGPGGAGDPFAVVTRVAARDGVVVATPGWCEIRLPLAGVDIDARRAGLDVDPGWVPWLGSVVMFRYA